MKKKAILATFLGLTLTFVSLEIYYQTEVKPIRERLYSIIPGLEIISKIRTIPKHLVSGYQITQQALRKKRYIKLARG